MVVLVAPGRNGMLEGLVEKTCSHLGNQEAEREVKGRARKGAIDFQVTHRGTHLFRGDSAFNSKSATKFP